MKLIAPTTYCPVCKAPLFDAFGRPAGDTYPLNCRNCGQHRLTEEAVANLKTLAAFQGALPRIAHAVYKVPSGGLITGELLESMNQTSELPPALERIDRLLQHIADHEPEPGTAVDLDAEFLTASLGCADESAAAWVLREAENLGFITLGRQHVAMMTLKGWQHHRDLMARGANSRHAFMAMAFRPDVGDFFTKHLKPAIKLRTDFDLRTTDHAQKTAGHIDSRMRVELHTSRFVVCDLTHNNRGAYWEAGFAEGIGRPVFYTCRQDQHDSHDPEVKPHFDIAHQAIVKWDPLNPGPAVEELVAMIRATLPAEARMED